MRLTSEEEALLRGVDGEAVSFAMRLIVQAAEAIGANHLITVSSAHVMSCMYDSQVDLDFAERLLEMKAQVRIPTTLNAGAVDLLHPTCNHGTPERIANAGKLMKLYTDMGCKATYTCAPFQDLSSPLRFGEHVAWSESNAVSFVNSVFGARTNRYGKFIDICAALTARVPAAGLHLSENRRGQALFRLDGLPAHLLQEEMFFPVLGHLVGELAGERVVVVQGLRPPIPDHHIKAFGAAAATSGAVPLYHIVGVTPEAPSVDIALQGEHPEETIDITAAALTKARDSLCSIGLGGQITTVCLGAPHLSLQELQLISSLLIDFTPNPEVDLYIATSRMLLEVAKVRGWLDIFQHAGARILVDRCAYFPGILDGRDRAVMTNSAKWAYYAPFSIGVDVSLGSIEECLLSARAGKVVWEKGAWNYDS